MIALGCDHGGYDLMQAVIAYLDREELPIKTWAVRIIMIPWIIRITEERLSRPF